MWLCTFLNNYVVCYYRHSEYKNGITINIYLRTKYDKYFKRISRIMSLIYSYRKCFHQIQSRQNIPFMKYKNNPFLSVRHHYNISTILVKLFDYLPLYRRTFVIDVEMVMDPIDCLMTLIGST